MFKLIKNRKKPEKNVHIVIDASKDLKLLQETEYLLNIFPEVVWLRILDYLDNRNDITNLNNSSPYFRNLTSQKRVLILFKDVFQVIVPHLVETFVFNCRLVCHSWKTAINELVEEFNADKNWQISPPNKSVMLTFYNIKEAYNFSSVELIDKLTNHFESCIVNPFFGRTISITTPLIQFPDDPQLDFYYKVFTLLDTFGEHVWVCNFHLSSDLSKRALEYAFVQFIGILDRLPYLRNLVVSNLGSPYKIPSVLQKPPKIKCLESLTLRFVSFPFANAIIDEHLRISKLIIDVTSINFLRSFVNLTELEIYQCSWEKFKVLNIYDISYSDSPNWPLKKLKVKFNTGVEWSDLFEILSVRFFETLEELELGVIYEEIKEAEATKINEDSYKCRLSLSKINKVHLAVSNYSTLDFLLGMKESLEFLRISWKVENDELAEDDLTDSDLVNAMRLQTVKILGYRSKLYKSNIWMLFPKLKTVVLDGWSIGSYSYSRREWLKRKNSGIFCLFKRHFSRILK